MATRQKNLQIQAVVCDEFSAFCRRRGTAEGHAAAAAMAVRLSMDNDAQAVWLERVAAIDAGEMAKDAYFLPPSVVKPPEAGQTRQQPGRRQKKPRG